MYLISSTKLRKARKDLQDTEPYFYALENMIRRMLRHLPEDYHHPYLDLREDIPDNNTRRAILCITSDKGLAGAYNHNVLKLAENSIRPDYNDVLLVIGEMGRQYFESRKIRIDENFRYTIQNPTLGRARVIAGRILEQYVNGEIDEVFVLYTRMKNSMEMSAEIQQILPLDRLQGGSLYKKINIPGVYQEEFEMLPSADEVVEEVIPNFMAGFIYGAMVESFCAEQNSRMTAMDNANKNGQKLLSELQIQYNRVRQAQITQEITEVAAGERAQRQKR